MAAYAALTSLINLIHQIQNHPSPPISIEKQQLESLIETATSLQLFLETYHSPVADSDEANPLEMRIADAAYAAEDVIESYIVDNIKLVAETTHEHDDDEQIEIEEINCITFYKDMQKVIEDMDLMAREVTEMAGEKAAVEPQLQRNVSTFGGSSRSSSIMVGFDKLVLREILDKLTAEERRRQVIPIVGMGGIGKTTLARHVYEYPCIKDRFDVCAWATISQKYNTKEILCDLLSQTKKKSKEKLSDMSEDELGSELHKCLFNRRFLVVMDDVWSIEAWDEIRRFFPDNGNSSRIVVTTRLSLLGSQLDDSYCLNMKFLDDVSSWNLFSKTVFGEEDCPTELEEIGKKIVKTCKELPLSIVVMGGLLKNLEQTQERWEYIRKNSSSIVNSVNEDYCLKILKMSYNHLPVYLKPCFLYMGVFKENSAVRVSRLVKLWVSEGFLKPAGDKSLETVAKEYLNDLVDRNLILVHEFGSIGNIKYCKIHDLLRDLCWREAGKEGFYDVIGQHKSHSRRQRCVFTRGSTSKDVDDALRSMPLARSFICNRNKVVSFPESRLLRILYAHDKGTSASQYYKLDDLFGFVNSRFLAVGVQYGERQFPPSAGLLWNLQTLKISCSSWVRAPVEIWKMSQLRHVEFDKGHLELSTRGDIVIMENLQTLKGLYHLSYLDFDEASKIFPNIKKLEIQELPSKLKHLTKLESCHCRSIYRALRCSFPYSLKKLSLRSHAHWNIHVAWILEKIGALPLLQKLKLERARFGNWETREDEFPSLKYLELKWCELDSWRTESSHFPRLEQLHLYGLKELEEIPCEIGEIATLQSIHLEHCSEAVVESAKKISEEQEDLRVRVVLFNTEKNQALRNLASPNFLVEIVDSY